MTTLKFRPRWASLWNRWSKSLESGLLDEIKVEGVEEAVFPCHTPGNEVHGAGKGSLPTWPHELDPGSYMNKGCGEETKLFI